ncbi:MAG: hypothetical protein Ct9H300mP19_01260 [Dehalococcoidia bacterium]|nr:MAG: hypothetical protein Ct9H300mP19_01260 [Dehalococcoidia bacterium]
MNSNGNLNAELAVPEVVIRRLPLYVRILTQFSNRGNQVIPSEQLGLMLH